MREFLKANFWAQCEQAYLMVEILLKVDHVATSCFLWKISYLGGCEDERGEDELFFSEALQMEFYQPVSKKAHRQRFHYLFSLSHDFMLHKGSRFLKCVGSIWALPI